MNKILREKTKRKQKEDSLDTIAQDTHRKTAELERLLIDRMLSWTRFANSVPNLTTADKDIMAKFANAIAKLKPQSNVVNNIYTIGTEELLNEFRRLNSVAREQVDRRGIQKVT